MNNFVKHHRLLGSSIDSESLSLTIKGIGVAVIPFAIFLFQVMGVEGITESDLVQLTDTITTAVASVMIIVGLARKIYVALKDKINK